MIHYLDTTETINNPSLAHSKCTKIINKLLPSPNTYFYIGTTHNPKERMQKHILEKDMHDMHIICEVDGIDNAIDLERSLIKKFRSSNRLLNDSVGGEGITQERNYIYLLLP